VRAYRQSAGRPAENALFTLQASHALPWPEASLPRSFAQLAISPGDANDYPKKTYNRRVRDFASLPQHRESNPGRYKNSDAEEVLSTAPAVASC
jgi:hypothetical protein